jgi:hypothetical protein
MFRVSVQDEFGMIGESERKPPCAPQAFVQNDRNM